MLFTEKMWLETAEKAAAVFRLNDDEKKALLENKVAKLIAAIPYNADCDEAGRTALSHLGTFMIAKDPAGVKSFAHSTADDKDMLNRLRCISDFSGGKKDIINKGMNLLALVMLEDHNNDLQADAEAGEYNPIASGGWDYDTARAELTAAVKAVESPEMDEVMTVENLQAFWSRG